MNTLMTLYDKGFNVIPNMDRFAKMTNQEVYDYYDYILNSVSIKNTHDIDIETLEIDDKFLSECDDGSAQGYQLWQKLSYPELSNTWYTAW